jgi:hypothetical protein
MRMPIQTEFEFKPNYEMCVKAWLAKGLAKLKFELIKNVIRVESSTRHARAQARIKYASL